MSESPAACARCGALAPLVRRGRCAECLERERSSIETDPPRLATLLRDTLRLYARLWLPASLLVATCAIPAAALGVVTALPALAWFLSPLIALPASGAIVSAGQRSIHGDAPGWARAVGLGLRRWPALFLVELLRGLQVLLLLLLFVVPGVVRMLSLQLVIPMVMRELRPRAALHRSSERMRGYRVMTLSAALLLWLGGAAAAMSASFLVLFALSGLLRPDDPGFERMIGGMSFVFGCVLGVPLLLLAVVLDAKLEYAYQSSLRSTILPPP